MELPGGIGPIPLQFNQCPDLTRTRLVRVAVRKGGLCYLGWRHLAVIQAMRDLGVRAGSRPAIGFIDQDGNYFFAQACANLAYCAGQLKTPKRYLCSQDLWGDDGTPVIHQPTNK